MHASCYISLQYYASLSCHLMSSGAAYTFTLVGSMWSQSQLLTGSGATAFSNFGWSVAMTASTLLIGAYGQGESVAVCVAP